VTGFTNLEGSIAGKWLELVKQIAPAIDRVAFLYNPATAPFAEIYLKSFEAAATPLKVRAVAAPVQEPGEIETIMVANAPGGLMVMPGPFFANHSEQVIALAARCRMPAIYPFRYYAEQGGQSGSSDEQRTPLLGWRPAQASHIRQHPVAAVIGIELPAALPADGGAAGGRRGVLRHVGGAAQAVGAAAAPREGCTRSGDADEEQQGCDDLDGQSHGRGPPEMQKARLTIP
jgi:hypothetical protein